MQKHYRLLSDTKQQYRQILEGHKILLEQRLLETRRQYSCQHCDARHDQNDGLSQFLERTHEGCGYREWQRWSLEWIENDLASTILQILQAINAYKNTFNCHMCGMCCRMASTDASYETLQKRAATGDDFARQFISIFLPYASREIARSVAPEVVDAVLAEAAEETGADERIYFYHCPYLGEDNRCSVFGTDKRPSICASYPETPLSFMVDQCAWKPWQNETHSSTLGAHALTELCGHYAERLNAALGIEPSGPGDVQDPT